MSPCPAAGYATIAVAEAARAAPGHWSGMRHQGIAKLDKRTKDLVKRLDPDDIAIIDHADMDRVSAEGLLATGVEVVVNAAPSISGAVSEPRPADPDSRRRYADRRRRPRRSSSACARATPRRRWRRSPRERGRGRAPATACRCSPSSRPWRRRRRDSESSSTSSRGTRSSTWTGTGRCSPTRRGSRRPRRN